MGVSFPLERSSATMLSPNSLLALNGGWLAYVPLPVVMNIRPAVPPVSIGKPAPAAHTPLPNPFGDVQITAVCASVVASKANTHPCQGPLSPCAPKPTYTCPL